MIRVGTRRSPLAQAQTDRVITRIPGAEKVILDSDGDHDPITPLHQLGAPGAFTRTLTDAILDGRIDAAVHSLKDLPLAAPDAAPVVAILPRDDPADVVLIRDTHHDPDTPLGIRPGTRLGTSAPRRQVQLRDADPSAIPIDVRGSIQTRIRLLETGTIDALLMAAAVFERLPVVLPDGVTTHRLQPTRFPGSPGQGAVAVQVHRDHPERDTLARLDDPDTRRAVEAERAVLARLGGGCGLPLGAYAHKDGTTGSWTLHATFDTTGGLRRVTADDGDAERLVALVITELQRGANKQTSDPEAARAPHLHVIVTMPAGRAAAWNDALVPHGIAVYAWPLITTEHTDAPLPSDARSADWVAVTSRRAVPFAKQAVDMLGRLPRIAAVGAATANALRDTGLPVHLVAGDATAAGLADGIARFPRKATDGTDRVVLWPVAQEPAGSLDRSGLRVVPWPVYRTRPQPTRTPREACDVLLVTSPSNARALAGHAAPPDAARLVALGPSTARALEVLGLPAHHVLQDRTPRGLATILSNAPLTSTEARP